MLDTTKPGSYSLTVTATSSDGYTSTQTIDYTVAKPLLPLITISSPTANATYTRYQVVHTGYSCQDATRGTGIKACTGSVATGSVLNTTALGRHVFTVDAASKDGASTTRTVTYVVRRPSNAFDFSGLTASRSGVLHIALHGLGTPGVVRATVNVRGMGTITENQTVGRNRTLAFTMPTAGRLRGRTPAPVSALVSIIYTPRGGLPLSHSRRVALTLP